MGMERFKWFDYLGALLLLFSVTKSAITPQVSADSSSPSTIPKTSVNPVMDSFQYSSEQGLALQVERLSPSLGPFLEAGSDLSGLGSEAGNDGLAGQVEKNLHQALNPTLALALGEKLGALNPLMESVVSQKSPSTTVPTLIW
jgi:hypothetical protein